MSNTGYALLEEIARGGFGVVQRVVDLDGIVYAMKTFSPGPAVPASEIPKHRARFIREVRYQRTLSDDFTMPVLDEDLTGDSPWFVMPLADLTYAEQIERDKALGVITPKPLADVLNALDEIHQLGFVHRDLKPQNVLLHDAKWKLADFGLVLPPSGTTSQLTSTHSAWGTQGYAAPEQVTDFRTVGPAADVFSFGCMLHDLVSNGIRVPFGKLTSSGQIGLIIEKCTEPDPSRRFKSIRALRSALLTILSQPTVIAPTAASREWREALKEYQQWDGSQIGDFASYAGSQIDTSAKSTVFELLDEEFWDWIFIEDFSHAEIIALEFCDWTHGSFLFDYCDVLASRLEHLFSLGSISTKAMVAVSLAVLGSSHHRWYVMRKLRRLCGPSMDDNAARRVSVEIQAAELESAFIGCLEGNIVNVAYHPSIASVLGRPLANS